MVAEKLSTAAALTGAPLEVQGLRVQILGFREVRGSM